MLLDKEMIQMNLLWRTFVKRISKKMVTLFKARESNLPRTSSYRLYIKIMLKKINKRNRERDSFQKNKKLLTKYGSLITRMQKGKNVVTLCELHENI